MILPRRASAASSRHRRVPPNSLNAMVLAASGRIPASMCFCVWHSMWNAISSSLSTSARWPASSDRSRYLRPLSLDMGASGCPQNPVDGAGRALPFALRLLQATKAGARDAVVTGAPIVRCRSPLGFDPAAALQPLQSWVERPLVDAKHVLGHLLDALADS